MHVIMFLVVWMLMGLIPMGIFLSVNDFNNLKQVTWNSALDALAIVIASAVLGPIFGVCALAIFIFALIMEKI